MPTNAQVTLPGLAPHAAALRAELLVKERERLLREVNKKKQLLERAQTAAEREFEATRASMAPLIMRHSALLAELTALFDELLTEGRLAARARKEVQKVRLTLELQGLLAPADSGDCGDSGDEMSDADARTGGRAARGRPCSDRRADEDHARPRDPSARDHSSASPPGAERRTLRDLFRSLARDAHPDRARQESERVRRTEVMKEVTRAYQAGDMARLIELESAWRSERVLESDGDPEMRCGELERINRELLDQVRRLTRDLRDVKRDARESSLGPFESVAKQASRELDDLESTCEFLRRFRDGKSTLAEFLHGPPHARGAEVEVAAILDDVIATLHEERRAETAARSRGQRRRR